MAIRASDILTPVRRAISDEIGPYRHVDSELLAYAGDGLRTLYSTHPEAFQVDDFMVDPPTTPASASASVPLDPLWIPALVHYIAGKVMEQDADSAGNLALAQYHNAEWAKEI